MPQCTVVRLPQERDKVSLVKRRLRERIRGRGPELYVGLEDKLPKPAARQRDINDAWERVKKYDLGEYTKNINTQVDYTSQRKGIPTGDSMVEALLLLTGSVANSSIPLSPKIWYHCKSKWALDIVRNEVKDVNWTSARGLGDKIESELNKNLYLAQATVPRLPKKLSLQGGGIDLPRGYTLFINYQDPGSTRAACGMLCSVAAKQGGDSLKYHSLCRIGGVLTVRDGGGKPRVVAVTAAHGLLDHFLTGQGRSRRWPRSITGPGRRKKHLSELDDVIESGMTELLGDVDEDKMDDIAWQPVQGVHAINWLGGGFETTGHWHFPFEAHSLDRLASDADFALLGLTSQVTNTYSVGQDHKVVTRLLRETEMKCGPVELVLSRDQVVSGTLLFEIPSLYLRGALFPTRKIQLDKPIGMGTSGCWVVQDGGLCGMIVASYTDAPFAHILTAEKLVNDIKKTLGNHIEVSLPSVLPIHTSPAAVTPSQHVQGIPGNATSAAEEPPENEETSTAEDKPAAKEGRHIPYWESDIEWYQDHDGQPSIATLLRRALLRSSWDWKQSFLPQDAQRDILSRGAIEETVRRCYSSSPALDDETTVIDLCDYICVEEPLPEQGPDKSARMLLAVLILVGMPSRIIDFFHERLHDADLPLRLVNDQGATFALARNTGTTPRMDLKCFSHWSTLQILRFDEYQWYMIAPYFKSDPDEKPLFYNFHDRIVLPFVEAKIHQTGEFSTTSRIQVHPAHHDLNRLELQQGFSDQFAVSRLHSTRDCTLGAEMEVSRMIPPHRHLVRSLCYFRLLDCDYVISPFAKGGTLYEAWYSDLEAPLMTTKLLLWVLAQCKGLAEGLATIHNPEQSPSGHVVRGLHGDISPRNVLFFPNRDHGKLSGGHGVLKLGDYGLASFPKDESSTSGFVLKPFTTAYMAPETVANKVVEQSIDIWALGCVYLEFVTWLLLGWRGVEGFSEHRRRAHDSFHIPFGCFFQASQESPQGNGPRFILGNPVHEWIRKLKITSGCPKHIQEFVRLIEESMLQVEPDKRSTAKDIANMLGNIQEIPLSRPLLEVPPEFEPTLSPPQEPAPRPHALLPVPGPYALISQHDKNVPGGPKTPIQLKPYVDRDLVNLELRRKLPPLFKHPSPAYTGNALLEPGSSKTTNEYAGESRGKDPIKSSAAYNADYSSLGPKQLDAMKEELRMRLLAVEELKRRTSDTQGDM